MWRKIRREIWRKTVEILILPVESLWRMLEQVVKMWGKKQNIEWRKVKFLLPLFYSLSHCFITSCIADMKLQISYIQWIMWHTVTYVIVFEENKHQGSISRCQKVFMISARWYKIFIMKLVIGMLVLISDSPLETICNIPPSTTLEGKY